MNRPHSDAEPSLEAAALAIHRSYTRASNALRSSTGEAGRAALLSRALASTQRAHPALTDLRVLNPDGVGLGDIVASIEAHGRDDVAAAIDALVGAVVDVLTRLIGSDMANQLVRDDVPQPQHSARALEA
jgi:hypothetical protein